MVCAFIIPFAVCGLGALWLKRRSGLTFSWWSLVVFMLSILASSPRLLFDLMHELWGEVLPPLWLREAWEDYSWPILFLWVLVLGVLLGFRCLRFTSRKTAVIATAVVVASVAPLVLLDWYLLHNPVFMPDITKVAASVSPDGLKRVTAFQQYYQDAVLYRLEVEENQPWSGSAAILASFILCHGGSLPENATYQLVWSHDSQVVLLLCQGKPAVTHDFSTNTVIREPWETYSGTEKGATDFAAFQEQVDALIRAHGGAAP
jgi:hypothetical protein